MSPQLTPQQVAALKAAIAADVAMNAQSNNDDGNVEVSRLLNLPAVPDFLVWDTAASTNAINDAINYANYTPNDAADNTVMQSNRLLQVNVKQMNLQNMIAFRPSVDASRSNIRKALMDATTALPTGNNGALKDAGGVSGANVLAACQRKASVAEKILAGAPATTGPSTANLLTAQGTITPAEVQAARLS